MNIVDTPKVSAKQIALTELAEEQLQKDVSRLKRKYQELETAKIVVKNIEREVEDLEDAIEQGN